MYYEPDTVWGRTIEGDEEVTTPRSGLSLVQRRRVARARADRKRLRHWWQRHRLGRRSSSTSSSGSPSAGSWHSSVPARRNPEPRRASSCRRWVGRSAARHGPLEARAAALLPRRRGRDQQRSADPDLVSGPSAGRSAAMAKLALGAARIAGQDARCGTRRGTRGDPRRAQFEANKLAKRLQRQVGEAIGDYAMIEAGDRVMVCLSGGKDSYGLLDVLLALQARAGPVRTRRGQPRPEAAGLSRRRLAALFAGARRRVPHRRAGHLQRRQARSCPRARRCARCARGCAAACSTASPASSAPPRSRSATIATTCMATFFLNLFFGGKLKTMPPKLVSDDGRHVVIRPLAYVRERDLAAYAELKRVPAHPVHAVRLAGEPAAQAGVGHAARVGAKVSRPCRLDLQCARKDRGEPPPRPHAGGFRRDSRHRAPGTGGRYRLRRRSAARGRRRRRIGRTGTASSPVALGVDRFVDRRSAPGGYGSFQLARKYLRVAIGIGVRKIVRVAQLEPELAARRQVELRHAAAVDSHAGAYSALAVGPPLAVQRGRQDQEPEWRLMPVMVPPEVYMTSTPMLVPVGPTSVRCTNSALNSSTVEFPGAGVEQRTQRALSKAHEAPERENGDQATVSGFATRPAPKEQARRRAAADSVALRCRGPWQCSG